MAKDKYAQWLPLNRMTQSAVDTDTRLATVLPTVPSEGLLMVVHAIQMMVSPPPNVDNSWVLPYIVVRDEIPSLESPFLVTMIEAHQQGIGGGETEDMTPIQTFPKPFLIAHSRIWLGCASHLTGVANATAARILYTLEKVSTEEFFEAIASYGN